jgi:electron transport complex protein RnfG
MNNYPRLIAVLTLICLVWTSLLVGVYALTKERIDAGTRRRELAAARAVIPGDTALRMVASGASTNFIALDEDGRLQAAAIKSVSPNGYGGMITMMVGFGADGSLSDFEVIAAEETPGLGAKIDSESFKASIRGKPADTLWRVRKDGGEIDAITAATISSRAALEAIEAASAIFKQLQSGDYTPIGD